MNNRLLEIIKYKTGGRQTEFAAMLGWTPQYLAKLLKGENFGITPVMAILSKFREINARWFLLGDGDMIETTKYADIRKAMLGNMMTVLDMEKYMPVMTPAELRDYEQVIMGNKTPDFSPELVEKWNILWEARQNEIAAKFRVTTDKTDKHANRGQSKNN